MSTSRQRAPSVLPALAVLLACFSAPSCGSLYYGALESFGIEKRHILVDRVEEGQEAQQAAKDQFRTTLDRFKELTGAQGGDLEETYRRLAYDYETCEKRAARVSDRIDAIEDVGVDMFDEWREEIAEMRNERSKAESERLLTDTEERFEKMHQAMRRAEMKMAPVLRAFKDQVLFLKHHLNAKMIAELQDTVLEIEGDVGTLIADMEASIAEAEVFIEGMSAR